ncbi:uncharacterized protein EI90DRAFT_3098305 [Cantharellus anzutake]|uniref:uncharacterized protein n=1 Tax=Cantharellus anzutake TaxID=1750568 RepID=UPI0019030212|nr:uncharacterized protein EI90DRAFT_3098305 [Cantharellus anzutake]KAF8311034.1 hypothetical protein EI90DRAFT_3098305 [Cantharellus anzutake]
MTKKSKKWPRAGFRGSCLVASADSTHSATSLDTYSLAFECRFHSSNITCCPLSLLHKCEVAMSVKSSKHSLFLCWTLYHIFPCTHTRVPPNRRTVGGFRTPKTKQFLLMPDWNTSISNPGERDRHRLYLSVSYRPSMEPAKTVTLPCVFFADCSGAIAIVLKLLPQATVDHFEPWSCKGGCCGTSLGSI